MPLPPACESWSNTKGVANGFGPSSKVRYTAGSSPAGILHTSCRGKISFSHWGVCTRYVTILQAKEKVGIFGEWWLGVVQMREYGSFTAFMMTKWEVCGCCISGGIYGNCRIKNSRPIPGRLLQYLFVIVVFIVVIIIAFPVVVAIVGFAWFYGVGGVNQAIDGHSVVCCGVVVFVVVAFVVDLVASVYIKSIPAIFIHIFCKPYSLAYRYFNRYQYLLIAELIFIADSEALWQVYNAISLRNVEVNVAGELFCFLIGVTAADAGFVDMVEAVSARGYIYFYIVEPHRVVVDEVKGCVKFVSVSIPVAIVGVAPCAGIFIHIYIEFFNVWLLHGNGFFHYGFCAEIVQ